MSTPQTHPSEKEAARKGRIRNFDMDWLKTKLDVSHFDLNAVLRGFQLTLVGAYRALQNPDLFTSAQYRQAAMAVAAGIVIRLILAIPIIGVKALLWLFSFAYSVDRTSWDDRLNFIGEYVLQVPFFLMTLLRHLVPTMDDLFMQSLQWVDLTYVQKHKHDNAETLRDLYYPNLRLYNSRSDGNTHNKNNSRALPSFLTKFFRKGCISILIFGLSYLPLVGTLVLPAASFYTFNKSVGLGPAAAIFGTSIFLPRRWLVIFLQTYFASRSLMRELLEPYFARIKLTKTEKKNWFRSREGVLFGFGLGFYLLIRTPLFGVLIYGIAEASTAYLVTKVTDPPPPPAELFWVNPVANIYTFDISHFDYLLSRRRAAISTAANTPPPPPNNNNSPVRSYASDKASAVRSIGGFTVQGDSSDEEYNVPAAKA
ncbi:putative transmembrane protein [Drechmeria coniospora]|uniref:Putative transmembrane protein n=1 Tax=Drechmeria coniospora TaxID=98403 RepID=A0A151GBR3_DRECN|nr:putative transmembrane protein [Drechmeria coniospora]KYK54552.1 putative transmembrane protein [Drechmeria coniospora]